MIAEKVNSEKFSFKSSRWTMPREKLLESKNIAYGRPTRTEACSDAEIQKDFSAIYNR